MDKKELEAKFIQTKSDIKAHMTMIKQYADAIQNSRNKLDELKKELEEIQTQYIALTKEEENEQTDSNSEESN